ncbi:copper resistance D family protein [Paenibacillus lemnae]|uniref:Copper resistance protein CopD n=1 Tax=Paenibacillus lemnae TaxID=1330551 RepID=A0A848M4N5_PAELE|nr:CopD family protein [Paenibacillus lemnae]NMO95887.1 copper resistance protein CopD [Paenibacillus lemnae]
MYWISEPFLYLGYATLAGLSVLSLLPKHRRPEITLPLWIGPLAALLIIIGGFIPLLQIILFFKNDLGLYASFEFVMFSFDEGKRYIWMVMLALLMAVISRIVIRKPASALRFLLPVLVLATAAAMASSNHAASLMGWKGQVFHFAHMTSMAAWTGTLLLAGFSSYNNQRDSWRSFLKWFHPFAVICVVIVLGSGILLMTGVAPQPVQSWIIPYGQALLIKHILVIPVLLFAFINGPLVRKMLDYRPGFQPRLWAKCEALLLFMIYVVTGYLNQQPALHAFPERLEASNAASIFTLFHPDYNGGQIAFQFSVTGTLLMLTAVGLFIGIIVTYKKRKSAVMALLFALAGAAALYSGIMLSVM